MKIFSERTEKRRPGFWLSLITLAAVCTLVVVPYVKWNVSMAGMFFLGWLIVIPICMSLGYRYDELLEAAIENCRKVMGAVLIVMSLGGMIGAFIACGAVPSVVYIGLKLISPSFFLPCVFIVSSLYGTITGTSWGTMGTVGVAFMLVGEGLGVPAAMTAGAVISGAYVGDGSSPVSDSTNLAAAVMQVDLFQYIRKLYKVIGAAILLNTILYFVVGIRFGGGNYNAAVVEEITTALAANFKITPIAFIPLILLLILLVMQKPALPSLLVSGLCGIVVAVAYQGMPLSQILNVFYSGYSSATGAELVDTLLSRGGITSLLGTCALYLISFGLIGMMQHTGMLDDVVGPIARLVRNKVSLVLTTFAIGFAGNAVGCSGSFASLVSGNLLKPIYRDQGYTNMTLARNLGSVVMPVSATIPWHINSVMALGFLGVSCFEYAPYLFHAFTAPIICFVLAMLNVDMERTSEADTNPQPTVGT